MTIDGLLVALESVADHQAALAYARAAVWTIRLVALVLAEVGN